MRWPLVRIASFTPRAMPLIATQPGAETTAARTAATLTRPRRLQSDTTHLHAESAVCVRPSSGRRYPAAFSHTGRRARHDCSLCAPHRAPMGKARAQAGAPNGEERVRSVADAPHRHHLIEQLDRLGLALDQRFALVRVAPARVAHAGNR